jgi:multiple antibiotic resistance protein
MTLPLWAHSLLETILPLFVTVDAFGMLPIFLSLTGGLSAADRHRITFEAVSAATLIAIGFMFLGGAIFNFLGISVNDFQIAGGILLLVLAVVDLLRPGKPAVDEPFLVGLVPLATPLIAGPATLTTVLVLARTKGYAMTTLSLAINFGILLAVLMFSTHLARLIGVKVLSAISKLVMVLLAAIAVNFIRVGITQVLFEMRK